MKISTLARAAATAALAAGLSLAAAGRAEAAFTWTLTEQAPAGGFKQVVASGVGSLNLTGLVVTPESYSGPAIGMMIPSRGHLYWIDNPFYDTYSGPGLTGPGSFGTGLGVLASGYIGDLVGLIGDEGDLAVPRGYASGAPLNATLAFDGTFLSLGLTPGIYTWTWPGDTMTVRIDNNPGALVPEPAMAVLCGTGLLGLAAMRRCRRCASARPQS